MPITATLDQIPRHRSAGASRWARLLSFFRENFAAIWTAAPTAPAVSGTFARAAAADPCDVVLFAACLEAEHWLAQTPAKERTEPPAASSRRS